MLPKSIGHVGLCWFRACLQLSANKFLKIRQAIEAGRSDWCCCHNRRGSGSRRAWSKVWLMTVSVVYLSPFVALSRQLITWRQCSLLLLLSTCRVPQSNRFHVFFGPEKSVPQFLLSRLKCWCDDHLTPTVWLKTKVASLKTASMNTLPQSNCSEVMISCSKQTIFY